MYDSVRTLLTTCSVSLRKFWHESFWQKHDSNFYFSCALRSVFTTGFFFNITLGISCSRDFRNTEFFPKFLSFFTKFLSFFRNFGQFFEISEYFFACLLSKSFRSIEFLSKILHEFFQKAEFFWAEFFSKC